MIAFAHTAEGSGTSLEQLALAAAVLVLGLAFLVQRSVDRRVSIGLVAFGLLALIGSFTFLRDIGGGPAVTVGGQEYSERDLQEAALGVCSARAAVSDDMAGAEEAFLNRAHGPLHVLATAVEDDDRALAGRLLVAKQNVESGFAEGRDPTEVERMLDDLLNVTVESLEAIGMEAPTC